MHVLMREVENGIISGTEAVLKICSRYTTHSITHKFCPGLEISKYQDIKSVRQTTEPFARFVAQCGSIWGVNQHSLEEKQNLFYVQTMHI